MSGAAAQEKRCNGRGVIFETWSRSPNRGGANVRPCPGCPACQPEQGGDGDWPEVTIMREKGLPAPHRRSEPWVWWEIGEYDEDRYETRRYAPTQPVPQEPSLSAGDRERLIEIADWLKDHSVIFVAHERHKLQGYAAFLRNLASAPERPECGFCKGDPSRRDDCQLCGVSASAPPEPKDFGPRQDEDGEGVKPNDPSDGDELGEASPNTGTPSAGPGAPGSTSPDAEVQEGAERSRVGGPSIPAPPGVSGESTKVPHLCECGHEWMRHSGNYGCADCSCGVFRSAPPPEPLEVSGGEESGEKQVIEVARKLAAVYSREYAEEDEQGAGTQAGLKALVEAVDALAGNPPCACGRPFSRHVDGACPESASPPEPSRDSIDRLAAALRAIERAVRPLDLAAQDRVAAWLQSRVAGKQRKAALKGGGAGGE